MTGHRETLYDAGNHGGNQPHNRPDTTGFTRLTKNNQTEMMPGYLHHLDGLYPVKKLLAVQNQSAAGKTKAFPAW